MSEYCPEIDPLLTPAQVIFDGYQVYKQRELLRVKCTACGRCALLPHVSVHESGANSAVHELTRNRFCEPTLQSAEAVLSVFGRAE